METQIGKQQSFDRTFGKIIVYASVCNQFCKFILSTRSRSESLETKAADLVAQGVPKEDIVLGFQSPFMRQFTEYAVN